MTASLRETASILKLFASRLTFRRDRSSIRTCEQIFHFARSRAAFVGQKKLYGYLKTRMGTRFPSMFEDDVFAASINIAKMQVFAACLADMSVFVIANAATDPDTGNEQRAALALECFQAGLDENDDGAEVAKHRDAWTAAFRKRVSKTVWEASGNDQRHFTESPGALVRWAPIADQLKKYDVEIVQNSIRYAWQEARREFLARLDGETAAGALHERAAAQG